MATTGGSISLPSFAPGYFVWAVLIENLEKIGYEKKNMYMAAYDWRLSFQNTEIRDQALSRLKSKIELMYVTNGYKKVVVVPHSMGASTLALPSRPEALIVSAWPPTSLPRNIDSIKKFENLQALTRAIRNVRAEYAVEPAKQISASIVANPDVIQYISEERDVLALLSRLDLGNINFKGSPPGDANQSVHVIASEGLEAYLPLSDMVDISAEVQRLSKRLVKMQADYDGLMARLSSPSFVDKAPEDIVRGVREKAAEAEEKLTLTKNRLNFLKSKVMVAN